MSTRPDPKISSLGVAFAIINKLDGGNSKTLSQLAAELDRPSSTVHDYLQSLSQLGLVHRDERKYRIGMRFLQIGGRWRADSKVFRIAEPEVRNLATKTGEHANLMIEEGGLGVFLLKQKGDRSVTLDTYEGMHVYLHTTALGKAILSVVDETGLDEILSTHGLPELTGNTITDESDLREELATVRERGYALDDAERINDVRCVAAPILSDEPDVLAAISISAPKNRMRGEYFNETIPEEVLKTANIINVNYRHD